ncbi:Six-hairpin glycosidase-like protein [Hypoxylon argillaceum]|nr:Six-hairpin glycosidase-like protein [Hypoxylon argillaceum]
MAGQSSYDTFKQRPAPSSENVVTATAVLPQHVGIEGDSKRGQGRCFHRPRRLSLADRVLFKMAVSMSAIAIIFTVLAYTVLGRNQPLYHHIRDGVKGTSFIDHENPISGFLGRTFLRDNIPYLDIPDKLIQDVFYYRWTSLQRNLRYVTAGTGYMCTEFVHPVGYAKAFGTIDAAAGHQIDEARWLRDTTYADDYIQLYTRGPADPLQYTQWILDATSRRAMVTGDSEFLANQLEDMLRVWHLWDPFFDSDAGLYYYEPVWDAQELSLPGFIADPQNKDWDLRLDGPYTYRPSHNAYMVANARAIARAAGIAHDSFVEIQFLKIAENLEAAMYEHLWAPEQEFFMDVIRPNNPNMTRLTGREQVGLFPYRFGIGLNESYAQPALDSMFDPMGFLSPYGPTTLEIRNQWFAATKPDPNYCCWWNGMSWPFSTSHTLKSLAAIYRSGVTNATPEQYYQYLQMYARTQQKDGMPYVAESHAPFDDVWSRDERNHSEHYDHSTNNDDIITGLMGVIPQADDTLRISPIVPRNWTYFALENLAYHGHLVSILYDKNGSRYNSGSGLSVYVDGEKVHQGESQSTVVSIPPPILSDDDDALINIAANPDGPGQYPTADATFTYPADYSYKAIDGVVYYDQVPDNRWTDYTSPNANDTLTVYFARPRNISSVTLALYSDISRGGSVDLPGRIEIYGSGGLLGTVGSSTPLLANDHNEIGFSTAETSFVAVNLFRRSATTWVGVCELEVWTPREAGPTYYAVDAHLTGAYTKVMPDATSTATGNGAVVGGVRADSVVAFSGIRSDGGPAHFVLSYANLDNTTVNVTVEVNQVAQTVLALVPSGGGYVTVAADIRLAVGKNYVSLSGGLDTAEVRYETLTIN